MALDSKRTDYVLPPPQPVLIPVAGSDALFPVRRIYCIGRNFAAHAVEMGHDPDREPPFFFQKNPDNILLEGQDLPYPPKTADLHFEVEMVIALGKGGANIAPDEALGHVFGYGVGLDMTRRDLQAEAKEMRRPWEIGKAFEHSAPCSALVPASEIGHPAEGDIWLAVDGERKQSGDLNQMIWKTPEMISYLSEYFVLAPGDLIFAGTPAGVGPVSKGQVMEAHVANVGTLKVAVI
ncbi:fumarylacetoacetate hydrolase family protein [Falsirhodobacter sp. alg1]|uniref:fumarylacetoacetate hydrolase family protein n=1 Tax=Falsirhodobacter sp. alg1 TaxID=1472418 RepID=UPI000787AA9F|nr:fumarylacetoacetate hydrolase family protein [Falsirhodobacter sp. alg1]